MILIHAQVCGPLFMASPYCPSVILCRVIIWVGDCPVHCMTFKNILGLSPLDASSIPSVVIIQNVSRLRANHPQLRIIALHSFSAGFMSNCLVLFDQWLLMWKLYVHWIQSAVSAVFLSFNVHTSHLGILLKIVLIQEIWVGPSDGAF